MKNFIACLFVFSIISCNSNDSKSGSAAEEKATGATAPVSSGGSCSNLVLFHEGAVITGRNYDGNGNQLGEQTTTISNVSESNGETVATASMQMHSTIGGKENNSTMNVAYKCDGKNLYSDLGSVMANFTALKDAKVNGSSLSFPLEVSVGESLPEASVSVTMPMAGREMKTTSTYKDRKVEAAEQVTTPAGTWACYKISSVIDADVSMGGGAKEQAIAEMMKKKKPVVKMIMWYAPAAGVVKTETYTGDKLSSRSEVISIKE